MQDEEIPSNQTFAEAIDYMGDKVANWFKGINDSADMHTNAVINLRPCESTVTDSQRTAIRNAFLEQHAPVVIQTMNNVNLAWCLHYGRLVLKVIDPKRKEIPNRTPVNGMLMHYCGRITQHGGDIYVGFHENAVVVEEYNGDTRMLMQILDGRQIAALNPWSAMGMGSFVLLAFVLSAYSTDKNTRPNLPSLTKE